jgi:hypothetical protein
MLDKIYKTDDPTKEYQDTIVELLHDIKIKMIKYEDNEKVSDNLFHMLKLFFNDVVIKDLIESIYPENRVKQLMRQHIIDEILKNK